MLGRAQRRRGPRSCRSYNNAQNLWNGDLQRLLGCTTPCTRPPATSTSRPRRASRFCHLNQRAHMQRTQQLATAARRSVIPTPLTPHSSATSPSTTAGRWGHGPLPPHQRGQAPCPLAAALGEVQVPPAMGLAPVTRPSTGLRRHRCSPSHHRRHARGRRRNGMQQR